MGFSNMMMAAAQSMPLPHVLLLLNDKHMVVEELLQFLVDKVDGDLFEAVVLEDLEAGDVEHSTEVGLLHGGVN